MYVKDFDRSGVSKQILSVYNHGTSYPIAMRDELIRALPYLKPRYPRYQDYAGQTVTDIFSAAELAGANVRAWRPSTASWHRTWTATASPTYCSRETSMGYSPRSGA